MKDIIITAGGLNIAPIPIEHHLKSICPIISYSVLIGDQRKYLSILITLKVKYDDSGRATTNLDPNVTSFLFRRFGFGTEITTIDQAIKSKDIRNYIQSRIEIVNQHVQSRAHTIKKWRILDKEFTVDNGELTPTLKIKRKVIENIYEK